MPSIAAFTSALELGGVERPGLLLAHRPDLLAGGLARSRPAPGSVPTRPARSRRLRGPAGDPSSRRPAVRARLHRLEARLVLGVADDARSGRGHCCRRGGLCGRGLGLGGASGAAASGSAVSGSAASGSAVWARRPVQRRRRPAPRSAQHPGCGRGARRSARSSGAASALADASAFGAALGLRNRLRCRFNSDCGLRRWRPRELRRRSEGDHRCKRSLGAGWFGCGVGLPRAAAVPRLGEVDDDRGSRLGRRRGLRGRARPIDDPLARRRRLHTQRLDGDRSVPPAHVRPACAAGRARRRRTPASAPVCWALRRRAPFSDDRRRRLPYRRRRSRLGARSRGRLGYCRPACGGAREAAVHRTILRPRPAPRKGAGRFFHRVLVT